MLETPWLIEVKREGADRERLFGNTLALCGFHLAQPGIWVLVGWQKEGRHEFFSFGKWPVTWRAADLGISDVQEACFHCEDGRWVKSAALNQSAPNSKDWLSQAVQFAINLGDLTATKKAPFGVDEQEKELRAPGDSSGQQGTYRESPPDMRWIVRHIYLDESNRPRTQAPEDPAEPLNTSDRMLEKVEVRAHRRLQKCGPGNSQFKSVDIDP